MSISDDVMLVCIKLLFLEVEIPCLELKYLQPIDVNIKLAEEVDDRLLGKCVVG